MNTLNTSFVLIGLAAIATYFISLNPKSEVSKKYYLTAEVEKLKLQYTEPDTCIKIEPNYDSNYIKNDFMFPNSDEMNKKLKEAIEKSFTKVTTKSMNQVVGVFKSGTCGTYKELEIFLDCEDDYPATHAFGWVGSSSINSDKNADLFFCVVENFFFETYHVDYAVLMLNVWDPTTLGFNRIKRKMSNEKWNNHNKAYYDGSLITSYGDCIFGSPETELSFYYFPGNEYAYESLPNLGFDYGVLGRFGNYQGYIFFDDEDDNNNNSNSLCIDFYNAQTLSYYEDCTYNNISNIMDCGDNTRFYISKIPNDCYFPHY